VRASWVAPDPRAVRAAVPGGEDVAGAVAEILAGVRDGGDAALHEYARRFDGAEPRRVQPTLDGIDPTLKSGLEAAAANVRLVAEAGVREPREVTLPQGHTVLLREEPVARAAVYVPGGRAPYPSTVLMGVVTARAAGVGEVLVCTPDPHPAVLAACALAGADELLAMGGAHAVAALAYGTETIAPVDVIVGPGNLYVQEAKRQVSGIVGIDGFAGPSDLVVLFTADPDLAAADLAAQAEHGEGSVVIAVSTERSLLVRVEERLNAVESAAQAFLVEVGDAEQGLAFAEGFAPEHLELIGAEMEALAARVRRAGCLFVGAQSATAFGDYVAGSNHVLPTGGAARYASALSPATFRRRMARVSLPPGAAARLAPHGAAVARAEGFEVHGESMERRA